MDLFDLLQIKFEITVLKVPNKTQSWIKALNTICNPRHSEQKYATPSINVAL